MKKILFTILFLAFFIQPVLQAQVSFTLPPNALPQDINKAEYFLDVDPGFGNGTAIAFSSGSDVVLNNIALNITGLTTGVHRLFFRTQDISGHWSETNINLFSVLDISVPFPSNTPPPGITAMEYFLDNDPGFGDGTPIPFSSGNDVVLNNIALNITGLVPGVHRIFFRTKDQSGHWSETNVKWFAVLDPNAAFPANSLPGNITQLEYFVDQDPGFGNGTVVTLAPGNDITTAFDVDVSGLPDGKHRLFIRTFDDWSLTNVREFNVGSPVPVNWISFTGKWEKEPEYGVHLTWQTSAEVNNMHYVVERSVDGIHFGKIGQVAGSGTTDVAHHYSFFDDLKDASPSPVFCYRIRQVDLDGKSSYSGVISLKNDFGNTAQVFPNPTMGRFRLYLNKKPEAHSLLLIYDSKGVLVLEKNIDQVITDLDLSEKAKGIYFLKVIAHGALKHSIAVTLY